MAKGVIEYVETRQRLSQSRPSSNRFNRINYRRATDSNQKDQIKENPEQEDAEGGDQLSTLSPYFDVFLSLNINKKGLLQMLRSLRQGSLAEFTILKEQSISIKGKRRGSFINPNYFQTNPN